MLNETLTSVLFASHWHFTGYDLDLLIKRCVCPAGFKRFLWSCLEHHFKWIQQIHLPTSDIITIHFEALWVIRGRRRGSSAWVRAAIGRVTSQMKLVVRPDKNLLYYKQSQLINLDSDLSATLPKSVSLIFLQRQTLSVKSKLSCWDFFHFKSDWTW